MRARVAFRMAAALPALLFADAAASQNQIVAPLPAPLVYLRAVEPSIHQDMRYATPDNFTGRPVPGYGTPECVLLASVAAALARVQRDIAPRGLSLKVYDCYRPRRAVAAFWAWANESQGGERSARFHPRMDRDRLHKLGYVAAVSGHSYGNSVDVTLVRSGTSAEAGDRRATPDAPCHTGPPEPTTHPSLDMGTTFDCFDVRSHIHASGLTPAQREARATLHAAMSRHGFRGYSREWWHFSLKTNEGDGRSFDLPITPYRP